LVQKVLDELRSKQSTYRKQINRFNENLQTYKSKYSN
jgi:hypothetical protein